MKRTRDGEQTKKLVIQAAKTIFAQYGFAGSSLAMITEISGISDGLILHHFKSKDNLYHHVLETLAGEYLYVIQQAAENAPDQEQAAIAALRAAFAYWRNDRQYHRISMWAYLENRQELIGQEKRLTAGLAETVRKMQAGGMADSRFSPYALLTMTIGPLHFWMRYHDLFRQATQFQGSMQEMDKEFEEEFIQMVMKVYQPVT